MPLFQPFFPFFPNTSFDYTNNKIITPVTVGSYSPTIGTYHKLLEVPGARFASDIILHGESYWVAADKTINEYSLKDNSLVRSLPVEGVRRICIWNNLLIVSRGEYNKSLNSYLQVYNLSNFNLVYELPLSILPFTTESIVEKDGVAYVGVNNGFVFGQEVGKIVILDLKSLTILQILDLGVDAKNPENLLIQGNELFSLNNKNYDGSSISNIPLSDYKLSTLNLPSISSLCGTSALIASEIWYQESGKTNVGKYNIFDKKAADWKDLHTSFYGLTQDNTSGLVYAAETDFSTFGKVHIYNINGELQTSFDAGITPGYFAFDYSTLSAVNSVRQTKLNLFPNPANQFITISSTKEIENVTVKNLTGEIVPAIFHAKSKQIDISLIPSGIYFLETISATSKQYASFIKK